MRSIETTVQVGKDGTATMQVPADVPPGEYRAVVVLEEGTAAAAMAMGAPGVPASAGTGGVAEPPMAAVKRRLRDAGLLAEINPPPRATAPRVPAVVQGQPLSELIIAERR